MTSLRLFRESINTGSYESITNPGVAEAPRVATRERSRPTVNDRGIDEAIEMKDDVPYFSTFVLRP